MGSAIFLKEARERILGMSLEEAIKQYNKKKKKNKKMKSFQNKNKHGY